MNFVHFHRFVVNGFFFLCGNLGRDAMERGERKKTRAKSQVQYPLRLNDMLIIFEAMRRGK